MGSAGDGVAQVAAVDVGYADLMLLHEVEEEAGHELVGIGASQVDVAARVAAQTVAYVHQEVVEVAGSERAFVVEGGHGVDAAGTPYEYLCVVLRVEIDQDGAFQLTFLEVVGAGHAGLLVHGDEHLQRAVLQGVVGEDSQRCSHTDAVVGAKGGAVGAYPLAVDDSLDGGGLEVEALVVALAHHVHMALQDHCRSVLVAGGGRFAQYHITDFVGVGFDAVSLSKIENKLADFLLFFRGARYFGDLVEDLKHRFGL